MFNFLSFRLRSRTLYSMPMVIVRTCYIFYIFIVEMDGILATSYIIMLERTWSLVYLFVYLIV